MGIKTLFSKCSSLLHNKLSGYNFRLTAMTQVMKSYISSLSSILLNNYFFTKVSSLNLISVYLQYLLKCLFFQISCLFSKSREMRKAVTCLAIKNQHCQICQKHFSLKSNNVMVWHRPVQTKPVSFLLEHNAISSFFQRNQSSIRHISATSNNSLVPNSPLVKEQNWTQSIPASTFRYSCRRFSNETEPLLHNLCQVDKYNGITVDLNDLPQDFSVEEFRQLLTGKLGII